MSLMQQIPMFIIFDLIGEGFEPTIWHIRGEHANHYTADAVKTKK
jgi:hypothetical protein